MKLITLVNAHNVLDDFAEQEGIGAHLAYWMTKFVVKTQADSDFYQANVRKQFEKYGVSDADGKLVVPLDKLSDFNKAIENLQNTEVEDPGVRFSLTELSRELKLSMKQMYPLLDFIDEEK